MRNNFIFVESRVENQVTLPFLFYAMLFSILIPKTVVSGVFVGVDDIVSLLGLIYLFCFVVFVRQIPKLILALFTFIVLFTVFGILQSYSYLGVIVMPTELWQYLKRIISIFIALKFASYSNDKSILRISNIIILVCFALLLIGFLQFLGIDFLTEIYGRNERQISAGLSVKSNQRIFGVSGLSTAWGGLTVFIFYTIVFFSVSNFSNNLSVTNKIVMYSAFFLVIVNVVFSGSRGAIMAFCISLLVFYLLSFRYLSFKKNAGLIILALLSVALFFLLLSDELLTKLEFIVFRFESLAETAGGGRDQQIIKGLSLLQSPTEILIGVSNIVQRTFGTRWGIESEPFYILVNYGVLGFMMVYGSILYIIYILFGLGRQLIKYNDDYYYASCSLISGLLGYLAFSLGYFYLGEVIVGNFSWLVFGVAIVFLQKKLYKLKELDVL